MNRYETVFIATPVLSEVQIAEMFSKFQGIIAENGGKVEHTEEWGLKKLAYPIQKKSTGYYFLIEFTAENGKIIETLETGYRRDERVIRFLTFTLDKDATAWAEKRRAKYANKTQE
ncbi:MAG: 30S ribosomal protein S6 [Rikenellaceae bacterium]